MTERWGWIVGYEGLYEVSTEGGIKSHTAQSRGRLLKPTIKESGHYRVNITKNGAPKHFYLHRLILETFIGACPKDHVGCHKDDDPSNNSLENLYWGTMSQNMFDKVRNGRHHQARKTHCDSGHPLSGTNVVLLSETKRYCRTCRNAHALKYYYERKAKGFQRDVTLSVKKSHCLRGHELSGDNLYVNADGGRSCRICRKDNYRLYQQRQKYLKMD